MSRACQVCGADTPLDPTWLDTALGRCTVWTCSETCADRAARDHPEQPVTRRDDWPTKDIKVAAR